MPTAPGAVPDVHGAALAVLSLACALSLGIVVWLAAKVHPGWGALALMPLVSLWRHLAQAGLSMPVTLLPLESKVGQGQIVGGFVITDMAYVKTRESRGWRSFLVTEGAVGESACRRLRIFLRHRNED